MRKPIYQLSVLSFVIFCCFLLPSCSGKSSKQDTGAETRQPQYTSDSTLIYYKTYVDNYKPRQNHIGDVISFKGRQKNDARYCWFSIDALQNYIDRIKKDAATGIRFYYAVYSGDSVSPEYLNYHTLVLVATKDSAIDGHIVAADLIKPDKHGITFDLFKLPITNHGQLCPPPDNGCPGAIFMNSSAFKFKAN